MVDWEINLEPNSRMFQYGRWVQIKFLNKVLGKAVTAGLLHSVPIGNELGKVGASRTIIIYRALNREIDTMIVH